MKWDVIYIYLLCARSIKENLLRSKYNINALIRLANKNRTGEYIIYNMN